MLAIEVVASRETKQPADKKTLERLYETTYDNGVMVRVSGQNIILSPPLIISKTEAQDILWALDTAFSIVAT